LLGLSRYVLWFFEFVVIASLIFLQFPNHTAQEWRNHFVEYVVPKMERGKNRKDSKSPTKNTHVPQPVPGPSTSNPGKCQSLEIKDSQGSIVQNFETSTGDTGEVKSSIMDEESFNKHMSHFARSFGLEVDFKPIICSRTIPLFRLWQVVGSSELGGYDEVEGRGLWYKVARRLNFNDFKHPTAAEELRACFKKGILADYADAQQEQQQQQQLEQDDVSLTDSQQQAMANEQLFRTATRGAEDLDIMDDDEGDDDLDLPQSTPRQPFNSPSSKRSSPSMRQGPSPRKRQKLDKGKDKEREIPSTPEDVINGNHLPRPILQSSPLKYTSVQPELSDLSDRDGAAEDDLYLRSSKFQRTLLSVVEPRVSTRVQEPETQDFTYSTAQHDEPIVIDDLTPSPERSSAKLPDRGRASDVATLGIAHSSNKNEDSSTQSQTESQVAAEIQARVDHYVSLGYPQDVVCEALEATSMQETNATHVMESLLTGEGIPQDTRGVWYWRDDQAIGSKKDSAEWDRIVRKHGITGVTDRKKFLRNKQWAEKQLSQDLHN
jgi:hypothetical protein